LPPPITAPHGDEQLLTGDGGETHDLCRWICRGGATANREAYRKHAEAAAVVFKEHGALKLVECWGDDVPEGKLTSFPMAVKRQDDETVVFSWILWPSRAVRDQAMPKVMADLRLKPETNPMPFDAKRLIYGGFEMIVEA
jgi:uncharacterized protein YbaA (DUF1428 family)